MIRELGEPGFRRRAEAMTLINGVDDLALSEEVLGFATLLIREKVMPGPLGVDAVHVACAAVHRVDYVLTWNIRHLANIRKETHRRGLCLKCGLLPPRIGTPDQFLGDEA